MLKGNPEISLYNRDLPLGCKYCRLGSKLVVFITGECGDSCYYCPVSEERFGKDVMYANEKKTESFQDFIYEAYKMNALGAGITGGDPILHLDKVVKLIEILKSEFGEDFHIHLYTSGRYVNYDALFALQRAGLDEIRFHPVRKEYLRAVEKALNFSFDVGLEVPAIPGEEEYLNFLIKWAEEHKVKFININELEITERNFYNLNSKGITITHGLAGGKGSFELALKVLEVNVDSKLDIHYCSSVYKDVVETRTRFLRTIRYYSKPYEKYSGEGTIIKAFVRTNADLSDYGEKTSNGFYISPEFVDEVISKYNPDEVRIVEELPYGLKISDKLIYSKSKNC
ncbi:radical SAM protein [Acidianus infernus]|uniref:Radical SAM protein n=1 Tax=Acidianus infernus TaxID=12915 RepID=A0A6A9QN12_ACIIN|nr:radical SAM protein [Acidianus infernus]MCY0874370.1 radical SAM protein [Acidianus infernus]MUM64607.1 radical SAM protein [Acidianus infernus]